MSPEKIAQIAHEINRAYCIAIGDSSQSSWNEAPEWQKDSAQNGVRAHLQRELTPEQSHELWLAQKREEGWSYGPVKDPTRKQHPCFMPYERLPKDQRVKDYLFAAVVKSLQETT